MAVSKAQVAKIALSFPGALEKSSYGRPAFFIEKKFFTRVRDEDNSVVMIVADMQARDMMLELDPDTYFITDHYRDYPSVLVRLSKITPSELKTMLQRRWERIAPKKMVRAQISSSAAVAGEVARARRATEGVAKAKTKVHRRPLRSASRNTSPVKRGRKTKRRK